MKAFYQEYAKVPQAVAQLHVKNKKANLLMMKYKGFFAEMEG